MLGWMLGRNVRLNEAKYKPCQTPCEAGCKAVKKLNNKIM